MTKKDEALFKKYQAAIERLKRKHGEATLNIDFVELIALIGLMQLALRHSDVKEGPSAKIAEKFIREVQRNLAASEPVVAEVIERGFTQ